MVDINDVIMLIRTHNITKNVVESEESIEIMDARYNAVKEVLDMLREVYSKEVVL